MFQFCFTFSANKAVSLMIHILNFSPIFPPQNSIDFQLFCHLLSKSHFGCCWKPLERTSNFIFLPPLQFRCYTLKFTYIDRIFCHSRFHQTRKCLLDFYAKKKFSTVVYIFKFSLVFLELFSPSREEKFGVWRRKKI